MLDVTLAGVVVHFAGALVGDLGTGAIGGGGGRAATGGAGDGLDGEMIDRHGERLTFSWDCVLGLREQAGIVCGANRTDSRSES